MKNFFQVGITLGFLIGFGASLGGCTKQQDPPNPIRNQIHTISGKPLFTFDYHSINEFTIARNDSQTGQIWNMALRYEGPEETDWKIENTSFLDKKANGTFIRHLLDTLSTLRFKAFAPNGPEASFGLATPDYAMRWRSPGGEFEIQLGQRLEPSDPESAIYAKIPGEARILVVEGAALQMLSYIRSQETLRHQTWATLTADDVDEIELRARHRSIFYAERGGKHWKEATPILEGITHARIQNFIDDPELSAKIKPELEKKPLYEMILKDRFGNATAFKVAQNPLYPGNPEKLLGSISTRPDAIFDLYPQVIHFFQRPSARK